ncbi:MAG TPA: hypothetical protein HA224_02795 [Nanoarchaeota archaeon]|nr:hypothetical protein [Nanoarchaeota archaeon]
MVAYKKAQGLPISTIVLIVIGLLVLFIIIAFFTGAFSKVSGNVKTAAGDSGEVQISQSQTRCAQWCLQMQGHTDDATKLVSSYCKNTVIIAGAPPVNCWQGPVFYPCEGAPAGCHL